MEKNLARGADIHAYNKLSCEYCHKTISVTLKPALPPHLIAGETLIHVQSDVARC